MKDDNIAKVKNIWETQNKILKSTKTILHQDVKKQLLDLFAVGNYYYFIFSFENLLMEYVHDSLFDILGIKASTFTINTLFELLHPEDLSRFHEKESIASNFLFNKISKEDITQYKVVYLMRLRHSNGQYKTILHQSKALSVSEDGKIQQVIVIHTDVTYLNIPLDHKISFISSERPSYYAINTSASFSLIENSFKSLFTTREIDIIKSMSEGMDFNNMANHFNVSPHTINTHKRNILKKSHCKNTVELMAKCIREGVI